MDLLQKQFKDSAIVSDLSFLTTSKINDDFIFKVIMLRICGRRLFSEFKFMTRNAKLNIRNSETLEINVDLYTNDGGRTSESIQIPRNGNLQDLANVLQDKLNLTQPSFVCNEKHPLHISTRIDILLNRYFYIYSPETSVFMVQGCLFNQGNNEEVIDGVSTLQLPAITRNEVENYLKRINQMMKHRAGNELMSNNLKLPTSLAMQVFTDAVIDPNPQDRNIVIKEKMWEKAYWKVNELRQKKREADEVCLKKVKRRMAWGLVLLGGNISFIWSGTYIFYSWDIMEPLAYFLSSIGGIALASQFLKIGKPYTNNAYQQYLMDKFSIDVYKQMGFKLQELKQAEMELMQLEASLKDYFLRRL